MEILDSKVLVLNKLYSPIRMTTVRDAFCKIFTEAAEVITVEDGQYMNHDFSSWTELSELKSLLEDEFVDEELEWVRTPSTRLVVPRVIRMLGYDKAPRFQMRLTRKNIYDRDNYTCQYCGKRFSTEDLNIDHVLPRSRGGKNSWGNLVCSCIKCNRKKKNQTPKEAGMKLLSKPYRPSPQFVLKISPNSRKYKDWDMFISDIYWNAELHE